MAEIGLLLSGLAIATIVMTLGIGGGILWTPLLMLGYQLSPQQAVATSLVIQVVGMGSGSFAYWRAGLVEKNLAGQLFLAALPGTLLGSFATVNLPESPVQIALGTMALMLALLFVVVREKPANSEERPTRLGRILPIPGTLGFATGLLSTGIGEWMIPILKARFGLDMRRAVATVIPVMFLLALCAALCQGLISENICWQYVVWAAVGTLLGGQLGPYLSGRLNENLLKESFIYLMTLVGIHLIFHGI